MYRLGSDFENVSPDLWISNEKVLKEKLLQLSNWSQIPLINSNASHYLPDNSMVRFRGMIQDMRNPEFYFESFEVYNTLTNEVKIKSGKYRDTADILENEKINYTTNLKSAERLTIVAISMPGLNKWVLDIENKENYLKHLEQQPNTTKRLGSDSGVKLKRSYNEVAVDDSDAMDVDNVNKSPNKELKIEGNVDGTSNVVSREHLLNFPLPDVSSQSCLIKRRGSSSVTSSSPEERNKNWRSSFPYSECVWRDDDGHLLNEKNNVKERWKNYFLSIFACEDTVADDNVTSTEYMIDDANKSEITMDEIMKALKCMKVRKFKYDIVMSDMLRGGGGIVARCVRQGCLALPWLFNLFMDSCLYDLKEYECGLRMDVCQMPPVRRRPNNLCAVGVWAAGDVDPALNGEFQKNDTMIELHSESEAEIITHNPPPSLVPRIHAVYVKKLDHYNPLVVDNFDKGTVLNEANAAREHLLKALTELLVGDKLAAEYLICHLISCVYHRQDTLALGKFCLNLSNVPTQKYPKYGEQLYDIIKQFVTKSYYLAMTLSNMNTLALLPKKDYECNRLTSGILQLSKNTHLILDETKLEQGRLDSIGVGNVAALGHLIQHQKVEYDFKYYKMEFDTDIPVLILSEGKSLLPSDFHVPLRPEESSLEIFDAIVEAATYYLKEEIMNTIRSYLTNIKLVKYSVTEDIQFVENDFIEMRANSSLENPVTADDLHRLLVLARLVSLSRGFDTLNKECWEISKNMEKERMNRMKNRGTSTI
ncbi:Mini-chromosome maintenance complex-binding protein [Eumeta japonica]|uniref:Mini-chromosome maintenance complex-binding protein n=1 Tax=Eumeta variegata TaxID=151549 RepID=A0A4C1TLP5_EUMVA|nr:Mini-chromosome maintenance complex-binding protein [Eumeta japonica]